MYIYIYICIYTYVYIYIYLINNIYKKQTHKNGKIAITRQAK